MGDRHSVNVATENVARDLCSACGLCAGICPRHTLTMGETLLGDLMPHDTGECAPSCRLCLDVCPFTSGVHDPRAVNMRLFGPDSDTPALAFHEDAGYHHSALVGYSEQHRPTSASGGLLTACLEQLLRAGEVDVVAVVSQSSDGNFRFTEVSSPAELRACGGSVYQPVEASAILRRMTSKPEQRWAVVAVPCLAAAFRQAAAASPRVARSLCYVLGLACGMYQNRMYTELLVAKAGVTASDSASLSYRVKPAEGPANNYGFQVTTRDGKVLPVIPYRGLPHFLGVNAFFRLNACNYCMDVFAEAADACFMDAWLPGYREDARGTSLVLVRNPRLAEVLATMAASVPGVVTEPISIEEVAASQRGHVRRKRQLITMRTGHQSSSARWSEKLDWWLQRRTQQRSKWAWARFGRRYGLGAFWLAMADICALQKAQRVVNRGLAIGVRGARILGFRRRRKPSGHA